MLTNNTKATVIALCFGVIGAVGGYLLGLPAPFLTGPALAVSLAGVYGFGLLVPVWLRDTCFILIGIGMGSGVTLQVVESASKWPLGIITLLVSLLSILIVSTWTLKHLFGFDRVSAVLASSPGHFSYILGLSADTKADVQRVSIVQSLRVLFLTMLVPLMFVVIGGDTAVALGRLPLLMPWTHILVVVLLSVLIGWGFKRFRIPAAFLLGGMLVSTFAHVNNHTTGDLPAWLSVSAFLVMGTLIGTRFSGITTSALRQSLAAGLVVTTIAAVISVLASFIAAQILGLPINHILIAFAPGGVETMAAMAVLLEVDPSFVAVHHVIRLLFLTILVPIILSLQKASAAADN